MLGCGLRPNTAMHAVEEHAPPPYLFDSPRPYTITDRDGSTFVKTYTPHDFSSVIQRYDRIAGLLGPPALRSGQVGAATAYFIDGLSLFGAALPRFRENPFAFVEPAAD